MSEDNRLREALVHNWFDKARESLASAQSEVSAGRLGFATNRLYYAMFYAITAYLAANGEAMSKHSGVQSAFHQLLIKPGVVDKRYGRLYNRLFDDRHQADYAPLTIFEISEVEERLLEVEEFLMYFEGIVFKR